MGHQVRVEFCMTNRMEGSQAIWDQLQAEFGAQVDLQEIGCLGLCEMCAQGPYCMVEDQVVRARNTAALYPAVAALVRDHLAGRRTSTW